MIYILHVWLIDRFTYCVNQRINQLIYGWINDTISLQQVSIQILFSKPTNWYSAARILYVQIFFHSIIYWCFWLIHEWLEIGSMPIVQAIFIISLTKNNVNNNNIVNEYHNWLLIMRIGICVQKQCLEQKWSEMMSSNSNKKWMNINMSNNTYQ